MYSEEDEEEFPFLAQTKPGLGEAILENPRSTLNVLGTDFFEISPQALEFAQLMRVPRLNEVYIERGYQAAVKGQIDQALAEYETALTMNPELASGWFARGTLLLETDRPEEAVVDLAQALAISPKDPLILYHYGCALQSVGDDGGAINCFLAAGDQSPDFLEVLVSKAFLLMKYHFFSEALEDFDRVTALTPENSSAYFVRGRVHFLLADYLKAISDFQRVLEDSPHIEEYQVWMGTAQHFFALSQQMKKNPHNPEPYLNRAALLIQLEVPYLALQDVEKAERLGHPQAQELKSELWRILLHAAVEAVIQCITQETILLLLNKYPFLAEQSVLNAMAELADRLEGEERDQFTIRLIWLKELLKKNS
jgi:tetratricopeptide (TPR) repeat protein